MDSFDLGLLVQMFADVAVPFVLAGWFVGGVTGYFLRVIWE